MKNLDNYLDRRFGYTRDEPFRQQTQATATPAVGSRGTIVTLSGEKWGKNTQLIFQFNGITVGTSPAFVVTDSDGMFSNVTIKVPNTAVVNQTGLINITDKRQAKQLKFTVISFTNSFTVDGVLA